MKWIKLSTATFEGLSMKMMRAKDPDNYFRNTSVMTHLLTMCGKSDTAGELRSADGVPLTTVDIAVVTGLPERDIIDSIAQLSDKDVGILGVTEDGAFKFLAWDRYQEKSRAEYQRNYRASRAAAEAEEARIERLFNEWWAIYPKKAAKPAAKTAWKKLVKNSVNLEAVIEATQTLVDDPGYTPFHCDKQYTPNPSTWLNNGRYSEVNEYEA